MKRLAGQNHFRSKKSGDQIRNTRGSGTIIGKYAKSVDKYLKNNQQHG